VLQLEYLCRVLASSAVNPEILANFIDEHIGYWLPDLAHQPETGSGQG
jgi:hypothetical protein